MFFAFLFCFHNAAEYTMKLAGSKVQTMNSDDSFVATIPQNHEAYIVSSVPIQELIVDGVHVGIPDDTHYKAYQVQGTTFTIIAKERTTIFVHMIPTTICTESAYFAYGMAYTLDVDTFSSDEQMCFFPISSTKIGYIIAKSIGSTSIIYKDLTNTMVCEEKCEYAYEQIPFLVTSGKIQRFKLESVPYKETEFTELTHGPFVFANSSTYRLNNPPFIPSIKEMTRDMITSNAPELALVRAVLISLASSCFVIIILFCICFSWKRDCCYKKRSGTNEYDYKWPFSTEQDRLVNNDDNVQIRP